MYNDLQYALRALLKSPGFSAIAILSLALGIGANTAMFSVMYPVLARPLPYAEPGKLMALWESDPSRPDATVAAAGNYLDWKEHSKSFESLEAYGNFSGIIKAGGSAIQASGARMTPGMLKLLRTRPALGEGFAEGPRPAAEEREILISQSFWRSRFGRREDIVGATIRLNDEPATIVGVMDDSFEFPAPDLDFWQAVRFGPEDRELRKTREWRVLGRLSPGAGLAAARAEMSTIGARIAAEHPDTNGGRGVGVRSYHAYLVENVKPTLLILGGVVFAVLLTACTNVASMMLARAAGRRRELAIRGALGAGRMRVMRQLLTESMVLAGLGAFGGILLAAWTMQLFAALNPIRIAGIVEPRLDASAFGFAAFAMLAATAIVAAAPAWLSSRMDLRSALQGDRHEAGGKGVRRTRSALLAVQLAFATVLLVGAGLLLRSMSNLHRIEYGFDPRGLLAATVELPQTSFKTIAEQSAFCDRLCERLAAIRGVTAVAAASDPPLSSSSSFSYVIAGAPRPGENPRESPVEVRDVSAEYFKTVGLPLIDGRAFGASDQAASARVAIVNRAFADLHFRGRGAVGQRIGFNGQEGPWIEIVGVCEDIRDAGLDQPAAPAIYMPYAQKRMLWQSKLAAIVRVSGDAASVRQEVQRAIVAADSELPIPKVAAIGDLYAARLARRTLATTLTAGFAALTLILGAIGVFGVISYLVAQRRREFGIRLALGATPRDISREVLAGGIKAAGAGALLGAMGASVLTRYFESLLFEIKPADPATIVAVAALLFAVALAASWLPARRAAKVDPTAALRAE